MEKEKLPSAWEFIKAAKQIYINKDNFIYLTKVNLAGLLISFIILAPIFIFSGLTEYFEKGIPIGLLGIAIGSMLVSIVAGMVWGFWFKVAITKAVSFVFNNKIMSVKETFRLSWARLWPYALVSFLFGLVATLGFLLLVIPGVILAVWYSFTVFVIVVEEVKVKEAFGRSKALVKGYFWPILGRGLAFFVVYLILEVAFAFIPIAGPLVLVIISPYFVLVPYLLYEELKRIKGEKVSSGASELSAASL